MGAGCFHLLPPTRLPGSGQGLKAGVLGMSIGTLFQYRFPQKVQTKNTCVGLQSKKLIEPGWGGSGRAGFLYISFTRLPSVWQPS